MHVEDVVQIRNTPSAIKRKIEDLVAHYVFLQRHLKNIIDRAIVDPYAKEVVTDHFVLKPLKCVSYVRILLFAV